MSKKLYSGLLILCLLLGMVALPAQASAAFYSDEPIQGQDLTGPRLENISAIRWYDDEHVFYLINGRWGLMDAFGNPVFNPVFEQISFQQEGYWGGKQSGKYALFHKNTQLTPYLYSKLNRMTACFRGEVNETYEFMDENGKKIQVPAVNQTELSVIDVIPGKAILLYQEATYRYDENYGVLVVSGPFSQVLDWKGNPLTEVEDTVIQFRDENSFVIPHYNWDEIGYIDESKATPERPTGYSADYQSMKQGNLYHILYRNEDGGKAYYLFDSNYNLVCPLDVDANWTNPVVSLSDTHFLFRNSAGNSIIMNASGQEVAQILGRFSTFVGADIYKNADKRADRFVVVYNGDSYLYDMEGKLLSTLEGAESPQNEGCYITAKLDDTTYGAYDYEGKLLFKYASNSGIEFRNGVILQSTNDGTAVLDQNGNPITDYQFKSLQSIYQIYGLIYGKMVGQEGTFLVNNIGGVLNSVGYDDAPEFAESGNYCTYKIGGKTGILRLVGPQDEIFLDVPAGEWYHDAVEACAELELFNGTGAAKFSPEDTMTRAMLVTVLWRLDGKQNADKAAVFTDVPNDTWYTEAVAWAAENGIVNGVGDGKFDPDGNVTREQIATIFCRYAESKGIDTQKKADLSSYPDVAEVSDYAKDTMAWVNAMGLIVGNQIGDTILLQPQSNATRAQVATIFVRYVNTFVGK